MAITTANHHHHHHLLLSSVDMSTLSPSELHSLSLLSSTSSSSAAEAADPTETRERRGGGGGSSTENDRSEYVKIVKFLKEYLRYDDDNPVNWKKKKRESEARIEIVNRNGVVVDLAALEVDDGGGGPFAAELRRLTAEREREEELLEVLAGIEGSWCSTRKKRRIVDACALGDALPVGWKVVIALRRKGGRFSAYCRRYISPTGEHFSTCKEVSSFLKSHFGINDTKLLRDGRGELQQLPSVNLGNLQCVNSKGNSSMLAICNASTSETREKDVGVSGIDNLPDVQVSDLYECHTCNITFDVKDNYLQHLMSTHERTTKRYRLNPAENNSSAGNKLVIRDANYGCRTPNTNFNAQGKSSEQLPSTEKKKKKKRGIVSTVADGVIMRDGKFECQFCDKSFEERRRYLGHLGNHIKGSIKSTRGPPVPLPGRLQAPNTNEISTNIGSNSKMDALVQIAHNSIRNIFPDVPEKVPPGFNSIGQITVAKNDFIRNNADFIPGKNSSLGVAEPGVDKFDGVGKDLSLQLNPCSTVNRTAKSYPGEAKKENREVKSQSEESVPPLNKGSDILVKDKEVGGERPGINVYETPKVSSAEAVHSSDKVGEKTMTNGIISGSGFRHDDLEVEKDNRVEKITSELKTDAQLRATFMADDSHKKVDLEHNYCFDAMTIPAVETNTEVDDSTINCVVKSALMKDAGSAEEFNEPVTINFLAYNQKPSDVESSVEKVQSKCMEKNELGHAQGHENSDLATIARDARAIGCTALLNPSSPFDDIFGKAGQNICSLDPNLESGNEFEFMKLDEIEPQMYKYNSMNGDDSIFLPEVSMDLEHNTGFNIEFNASANPESEFPEAAPSRSSTTMMTCVWCCSEFSHEIVELEPQPDSVGFMCPDCRTKISKQFNDLESNFSLNSF